MSLTDSLKSDLNGALKSNDSGKTETLRGLLASIHNEEISKRSKGGDSDMSDEDVVNVLQKEAKKRREASEIYGKAGRKDLEDKENAELSVIESYLPPQLSESEIDGIVKKIVSGNENNFGQVMGKVMKEIAGRADSKLVSEIVKKNIGGE